MGKSKTKELLGKVLITGVVCTMVGGEIMPVVIYAEGINNSGEMQEDDDGESARLTQEGSILEDELDLKADEEGVNTSIYSVNQIELQAENTYVMATDKDFSGTKNGNFRYIGKAKYVEVPARIKGVNVTSYAGMFRETSVSGVKSTNKNVTSMAGMFGDFQGATLDVSLLDTIGVQDMSNMFSATTQWQTELTKVIGLDKLNTGNVLYMDEMFYRTNIQELNLSNFDTGKVLYMNRMFGGSQAHTINTEGFNTVNVVDMEGMFSETLADELDVSSFNTAKVTDMQSMFEDSQATNIKGLTNLTTTKVVTMANMFRNAKAVTIQTSHFDTANVEDMSGMFAGVIADELILTNFNTGKVTSMSRMFEGAKATQVDVSSFNTSNVKGMNSMFRDTSAVELDLGNFNTVNVTDMIYMFRNSRATHIDTSSFNTRKVTKMTQMFESSQVKELDLSGFGTRNVMDMRGMFKNSHVQILDLSAFNTKRITDMSGMFEGAQATSIDVRSFDTMYVTNMSNMFKDTRVEELDLSSFDMTGVNTTENMFLNTKAVSGLVRSSNDVEILRRSENKPSTLNFKTKYELVGDESFRGFYNGIFRYIGDAEYIEVPHEIKGVAVTSYKGMFENTNVKGVISTNPNITDMSNMFKGNTATQLDVRTLNTENTRNMSGMFEDAKTTELDLGGFKTVNATNMSNMFKNTLVDELDLGSFDMGKVANTDNMFQNTKATVGYARTLGDAEKLNGSLGKPQYLTIDVWGIVTTQSTDEWTNEPIEIRVNAVSDRYGVSYVEMVNDTGRNYLLQSRDYSDIHSNNDSTHELIMGYDATIGANWMSGINLWEDTYEITTYIDPTFTGGRGSVYSEELFPIPEELTYSVMVMSPAPLRVYFDEIREDEEPVTLVPNQWTRVTQTVINDDSDRPTSISVENMPEIPLGTKLYYKEWKIEKGTTATPWKPAPEDTGKSEEDDDFTVYDNGTYIFRATDNQENTKTVSHRVSNIDRDDPTAEIKASPEGWTSQDVTITVNATDGLSGIDYIEMPNGEKVYKSEGEYHATENGSYTFKVVDKAGNEVVYTEEIDNIDKTIPQLSAKVTSTMWTSGTVGIEVVSGQSTSGLEGIELIREPGGIVTEGNLANNKKVYTVSGNGLYTFQATYGSGATSEVSVNVTNIDKEKPNIEITGNVLDWVEEDVITLTVTAIDAKSGVKSITLPNGKVISNSTATYMVTTNGNYTFIVTDNVGNTETVTEKVEHLMIPYSFYIYDKEGNPVQGAVFELYREDEYYKTATSSKDGLVDFGKVPPEGKYQVRQITAPDGVVVKPEDINNEDFAEPIEFFQYPRGNTYPATGTTDVQKYAVVIGLTTGVLYVVHRKKKKMKQPIN